MVGRGFYYWQSIKRQTLYTGVHILLIWSTIAHILKRSTDYQFEHLICYGKVKTSENKLFPLYLIQMCRIVWDPRSPNELTCHALTSLYPLVVMLTHMVGCGT